MPSLSAPVELHIDPASTVDVFVHPSALPADALSGDLVAIRPVLSTRSKGKGKDKPLLFKVDRAAEQNEGEGGKDGPVGIARRRGKALVTVSPTAAQSFGWVKNRIEVELSLIPSPPPRKYTASHVELYFNNMYLSRPDSFQLSLALAGRVLHVGQRVVLPGSGARLRVGDMYSAVASRSSSSSRSGGGSSSSSSNAYTMNTPLDAAYITDETKIVFRSESARHYVFVEVSQDLWQFEEDGSMLLEKAELFLQELFAHVSGKMTRDAEDKRSKGVPTSHVMSIILFGRVIYDDEEDAEEARAPLCRLENGTLYRDFYKVILDLTPSVPPSIIHTVALELRRWQSTVLLRTRPDGSEKLSGRLAYAHESPVLEATNLALNSLEEHWIDRDLQRTGLEIVVMTAGSSFYQVEKSLLRLTTERMLYHGVGLDLISLSKMPLHTVPLFQFRSPDPLAAEMSVAVQDPPAGAGHASKDSLGTLGTSFRNSPRSPANFGPNRLFHGPSSLRNDRHGPSPALRDPHALDPVADQTPRVQPIHVPDDQRDPLYFDPPPPAAARAAGAAGGPRHARQASAQISLNGSVPIASFSASPAFPSSSAPSNPPPLSFNPGSTSTPTLPSTAGMETSLYYAEPLFVFPHFFGTQLDKPHRIDRFMPRARCYELFTQGVSERAPIAIPLLAASHKAFAPGEEAAGQGFLSDLERRVQRREAYDAAAVGARIDEDGGEGGERGRTKVWELKESGTLTGSASEGSLSASAETSGLRDATTGTETPSESDEGGKRGEKAKAVEVETTMEESDAAEDEQPDVSKPNALGLGLPAPAGGRPGSLRRQAGRRDRAASTSISSTALTAGPGQDDDDDRGRRSARLRESEHPPSSGRSKTPVPHSSAASISARRARSRAGSIAGSVRSVSTSHSRAPGATLSPPGGSSLALRKASTPALIARLTGQAAPPASSSGPSASTSASASISPSAPSSPAVKASSTASSSTAPRPSWLNLFGRATSSLSASSATAASSTSSLPSGSSASTSSAPTPAPQVAVARVDVQANLKPDWAAASSVSGVPSDTGASDGTDPLGPAGADGTAVVLGFSSASQRPSSRSRTRAEEARLARDGQQGRTMPISIGSRAGEGAGGGAEKGEHHAARSVRRGGAGAGAGGKGSGSSTGGGKGMSSSSLKVYELDGSGARKAFGMSGAKVSVAERFNPSKPGKRSVGLADQARRWAGILIAERRSLKMGVKWRSITRGACLPITTDYLPSADALAHQYSEYRYTVPTSSAASSPFLRVDHPKRSHTLTLIMELICQRLSHGFQICTPANAVGALDAINVASSKTLPDVLRDVQDGEATAVYLSLSNQVHRIWYDRRTSSVFVKVLRRRRTWGKVEYNYQPLVWTRGFNNYDQITRLSLPYPDMIEPSEWQHGDRLIAGAEKPDVAQNIRYRRTRLLLLPAVKIPDRDFVVSTNKVLQGVEAPSDAMIQAQGFYALMELIENARWTPAGVEKEPLSITQTTLDAPGWAASVAQAQAADAVAASPSVAPVQHPRTTWLSRMQSRAAKPFEDSVSTPIMERNFELPPTVTSTPGKEVVAALTRSDTSSSLATISTSAPGPSPTPRRPTVQMTYAVTLDFDKDKRSDRAERVLCHLDRSHNVSAAYHVELAWLTASGKAIDNAIQSWTRQMARYGLNLIEVSTRPVLQRHNPFHKPSVIRLAVQPPSAQVEIDDEEGALEEQQTPSRTEHYLSHLLRSLDYFLDLGADSSFPDWIDVRYSYRRVATTHSQYIHRTGAILISIFEDDDGPGLAYVWNRVFTTHHPEADPWKLIVPVVDLCADETRLRAFWREVDERA
ncbi:hypothetical protein JCM8097_008639 [Rhodosporidiobolus ruineniae]